MNRGRIADEAVQTATGKTWPQWFAILNKAGAKKMDHADIAHLLSTKYIESGWWAQMVTVEYERAHDLREVNQRRSGSYEVSAHRTFAMPVAKLYAAWLKAVKNHPGLKKKKLEAAIVKPQKIIRYKAGKERIVAAFAAVGAGKSRIGIDHEELTSRYSVDENRTFWRRVLTSLSK